MSVLSCPTAVEFVACFSWVEYVVVKWTGTTQVRKYLQASSFGCTVASAVDVLQQYRTLVWVTMDTSIEPVLDLVTHHFSVILWPYLTSAHDVAECDAGWLALLPTLGA